MLNIWHDLGRPVIGLPVLGMVAVVAIFSVRWLNRRRRPDPASIEPVEFSGRTRAAFLQRVWAQRIVNGLESSLQQAAEIALGMRNTPELVKLSYSESTAEPGELLTVEEAYEQAGGQLVIVGPPGSGKTTEALKLMRHLLEVARQDPSAPVPEMFPLASWAKESKPLLDWLADQLQLRHGYAPREGRSLIANHHVVPVLDGLDEVASPQRAKCVQEFNRFWDTYRGGPVVVCSRPAEYEEIPERLKLGGGVTIDPPNAQQIDQYLDAAGPGWDRVRAQLREDSSVLREVLATPLMLSVAVLAYRDQDPDELGEDGAADATTCRRRLWSHYVTAMTTRGYHPDRIEPPQVAPYTEDQVRRWLGWLAQEMRSRNETELWLHEWSGPASFRAKVRIGIGAVFGLALGLASGLGNGVRQEVVLGLGVALLSALVFGLSGKVIVKPEPAYRLPFDRRRLAASLLRGLSRGLGAGLGAGLALGGFGDPYAISNYTWLGFGLIVGLVFALAEWLLKPRWIAHGRFKRRKMLVKRLLVGLVIGLFVVLVGRLGSVLVREMGGGLLFGLFVGWPGDSAPLTRGSSNRRQLAMILVGRFFLGLFAALAFGYVLGVVSTPAPSLNGLDIGVVMGLVVGLLFGLASALISFGPDRERLPPTSPTKLIADSARIGVVFGSVFASVFVWPFWAASRLTSDPWLAGTIGLSSELTIGLGFGLALGLDCVIFHHAFRLWLRAHDKGPPNWPRFLHWARERMLLRSTGGSYEWVHLELRDYLASQESEEMSKPGGERVGPSLETLSG